MHEHQEHLTRQNKYLGHLLAVSFHLTFHKELKKIIAALFRTPNIKAHFGKKKKEQPKISVPQMQENRSDERKLKKVYKNNL